MRLSKTHLKTLREAPSDAVLESHKLLVRANMIKQESAGVYMYPKLGWRTVRKVEQIVREEDADAFMIVSNATEIFGEGYKSYFSEKL